MTIIKPVLITALLLAFVHLNVSYWQDPVFWRRWWDLVTHIDPAYMNYKPVETVVSTQPFVIPHAQHKTISSQALDAAVGYAKEFNSFSLLVIHRGQIQREWYNEGWDSERLTQSQSMHKTVVALLIGVAISEGHINSVDDEVVRYFPEWAADSRGRITIRDLLTMSSGLEQYAFSLNPFAGKSVFRFLFAGDRERVALTTVQRGQPQTKYDYNDINAQLLGLLLERATGARYSDYLQAKLWQPMGGQSAQVWLDHEQGVAMTACCLLAPTQDWGRIGLLMKNGGELNGEQIIPRDWIKQMLAPSKTNSSYGYLTWLGNDLAGYADQILVDNPSAYEMQQSEPFAANDLFLLLGYGGQRVYVSVEQDLVVVRMGPFAGYQALKLGWDNAYLVNTLIRGIEPSDTAN